MAERTLMSGSSSNTPSNDELILLAVAEWGYPIEEALNQHFTVNGRDVMRQAFQWAGLWTPENHRSLYQDDYNETVDSWYETLIAMCRREGALVRCPSLPDFYSYATYSAFGLTESGWSLVESVRKDFPDLQKTFAK